MTAAEEALRRYMRLARCLELRWDAAGEAVERRDSGETVAFRSEIRAVVEALARQNRVPPLTSVLAAFSLVRSAATRGGQGPLAEIAPAVWALPGAAALAVVYLLERSASPLQPRSGAQLLEGLASGFPQADLLRDGPQGDQQRLFELATEQLTRDLPTLDPGELARRIRTGVAQEVQPAPTDLDDALDDADRVGRLVRELQSDAELGAVARLARDLMAALRLPSPASEEQDLPIGGYADIANRGELDRLLLTELAQDDDVLASRLVLGEALFLRREVPRDRPKRDLTLVIDAGIRTWGVTRVFATAAALAVAAGVDRGAALRALRANGAALEPVDLTTRAGVEEHMARLTADPHPGRALVAVTENDAPSARRVLVTTRAAFRDGDLRANVTGSADWSVVTVDGSGEIELYEVTARGARRVAGARVDLAEALGVSDPERRRPLEVAVDPLPAYLEQHPSPLRISHDLARVVWLDHPLGTLVETACRRVMLWRSDTPPATGLWRHGAIELGLLPGGDPLALEATADGALALTHDRLAGRVRSRRLSVDRPPIDAEVVAERRPNIFRDPTEITVVSAIGDNLLTESGLEPVGPRSRHGWLCKRRGPIPWETMHERVWSMSLLRKVSTVGVGRDPRWPGLRLELRGRSLWALVLQPGRLPRLTQSTQAEPIPHHALRPLESDHPAARFLRLHRWPDGSIAWTDRRGLLHLRSGDPAQGEVSLTLDVDQAIAAWSTRGWVTDSPSGGAPSAATMARLVSWLEGFVSRITELEGSR